MDRMMTVGDLTARMREAWQEAVVVPLPVEDEGGNVMDGEVARVDVFDGGAVTLHVRFETSDPEGPRVDMTGRMRVAELAARLADANPGAPVVVAPIDHHGEGGVESVELDEDGVPIVWATIGPDVG